MIARIRKAMEEKDQGFTLVELLVVIIIIGILAAIAIPAFLRQRENAWEAAVISDLKNASIAAESFATQNNGTYAGMTKAELELQGFNETDGVNVNEPQMQNNDTEYTISATHDNLGADTWTYSSVSGVIEKTP